MPVPPLKIDPSNRNAHVYLDETHECIFFYEYTSREGPQYSVGNQLIYNLKKSVRHKGEGHYKYKLQAIGQASQTLRAAFERSPRLFTSATFTSIPPSKLASHPEYDDRMQTVVANACLGKGADVRELVLQTQNYEASHNRPNGHRLRPHELEALYDLAPQPPKATVVLVDDVLTTGAHFVAARNVIHAKYPDTRVFGVFIARRVIADPAADFDAL